VSKSNGLVEVAELQVGNLDEMLISGNLRIVIKPGSEQSVRTRTGMPLDSAGSPKSSNGECCYLAFADEFIFDVHQGDGAFVFSIYDCDALMDDRIASASVPAKELLSMASQRREYFSLELNMENQRWQRWEEIEGIHPFIAMRLIELDPNSNRAKARGRQPALKRRATGLPY